MPGIYQAADGNFPTQATVVPSLNEIFLVDNVRSDILGLSVVNATTERVVADRYITWSNGVGSLTSVYNPVTRELDVVGYCGIWEIDPITLATNSTVDVPCNPTSLALNPGSGTLYVGSGAWCQDGSVSVINVSATQAWNLTVPNNVQAIAYSSSAGAVLAGGSPYPCEYQDAGSALSSVNVTTGKVTTVDLNGYAGIESLTLGSADRVLYGLDGNGSVDAFNPTNLHLRSAVELPSGDGQSGSIVYNPVTHELDETDFASLGIRIIDPTNLSRIRYLVCAVCGYSYYWSGGQLTQLGIDPVNGTIYAPLGVEDLVLVSNGTGRNVTNWFTTFSNPTQPVIDPTTGAAIVGDTGLGAVDLLNASHPGLVRTNFLRSGSIENQAVYDPNTGSFFGFAGGIRISPENGSILPSLPHQYFLDCPGSFAFGPHNRTLWIVQGCDQNVIVLNSTRLTYVANFTFPYAPTTITYDPVDDEMYIASTTTNITVVDASTLAVEPTILAGYSVDSLVFVKPCACLYAALTNYDRVEMISTVTGTVTRAIVLPGWDWQLTYIPAVGYLYAVGHQCPCISPFGSSAMAMFFPGNGTLAGDVPVGNGAVSVVFDPVDRLLIISCSDGTVTYFPPLGASFYRLDVQETGLPAQSSWQVTVGNYSGQVIGSSINLTVPNGSFEYSVSSLKWHVPDPESGYVQVLGSDQSLTINFTELYVVRFRESGLPDGTSWAVNENGTYTWSSSATIPFVGPNGSFWFHVTALAGYNATPSWGNGTVSGSNMTESIVFSIRTYDVTFQAHGLPPNATWWVNLTTGPPVSTNNSSVSFSLGNGTYYFQIGISNPSYEWYWGTSIGWFGEGGADETIGIYFVIGVYGVEFDGQGLPGSAQWSADVSGGPGNANLTINSTSSDLTAYLQNGSYQYTINSVPGYVVEPASGTFTVEKDSVPQIELTFVRVMYAVSFSVAGLPPSSRWWVNLSSGASISSELDSIEVSLPNGTYSYSITSSNTSFVAEGGRLTVAGQALEVSAQFSLLTFTVDFDQAGLPSGTAWWVNLTGHPGILSESTGSFASLPNGSYAYRVAAENSAYAAKQGTFVVDGAGSTVSIVFRPVEYTMRFSESGLPNGTAWSVSVGAWTFPSDSTNLTFQLMNGSYSYSIGTPSQYQSSISNGTLLVAGGSIAVELQFTPVTTPPPPSENETPPATAPSSPSTAPANLPELWLLLAIGLGAAATGGAIFAARRRRIR